METKEVLPLTTSVNRHNLGRLILAARAVANLTRVQLAKSAHLAHTTVKRAEEGEESVPEDALTKICRAMESVGFEFLDGTRTIRFTFHEAGVEALGVIVDVSMPGWIRRVYLKRSELNLVEGKIDG